MVDSVLIAVIALLIISTLPAWPYSKAWDYYPSALLSVILAIVLMLVLLGRI
jgi:Protein of unknown function (DUF3309)